MSLGVITVFFRQVDSEFVKDFACVARQTAKQCTVAVHYDETKLAVIRKQSRQCLHKQYVTVKSMQDECFGHSRCQQQQSHLFTEKNSQSVAVVDPGTRISIPFAMCRPSRPCYAAAAALRSLPIKK